MHLVNEIARDIRRPVHYSKHLKERLKLRKISDQEMIKTVMFGSIEVGGMGQFKAVSKDCHVIVKLRNNRLVIVTAWRRRRR